MQKDVGNFLAIVSGSLCIREEITKRFWYIFEITQIVNRCECFKADLAFQDFKQEIFDEGFVFCPLCPLDISPKFQSAEFRGDLAMGIVLQAKSWGLDCAIL